MGDLQAFYALAAPRSLDAAAPELRAQQRAFIIGTRIVDYTAWGLAATIPVVVFAASRDLNMTIGAAIAAPTIALPILSIMWLIRRRNRRWLLSGALAVGTVTDSKDHVFYQMSAAIRGKKMTVNYEVAGAPRRTTLVLGNAGVEAAQLKPGSRVPLVEHPNGRFVVFYLNGYFSPVAMSYADAATTSAAAS